MNLDEHTMSHMNTWHHVAKQHALETWPRQIRSPKRLWSDLLQAGGAGQPSRRRFGLETGGEVVTFTSFTLMSFL